MVNDAPQPKPHVEGPVPADRLPKPTAQFKRRAWLQFQRALDPLAPPKPMRPPRLRAD